MKQIALKLLSALAMIAALPAFGLDVAGVQLGSNLPEALQKLQQVNPKFSIRTITNSSGPSGLIAIGKEPRSNNMGQVNNIPVDEMLVLKAELDKVWFIGRRQDIAKDQSFTTETLKSGLTKKYGTPSKFVDGSSFDEPGTKSGVMTWAYDRSGKQSFIEYKLPPGTYPENQSACIYVNLNNTQSPVNDNSTSIRFPYDTKSTCGLILDAVWVSVDGFVKSLVINAFEVKTLHDAKVILENQAATDKQRAFDDQANKKIAPKL